MFELRLIEFCFLKFKDLWFFENVFSPVRSESFRGILKGEVGSISDVAFTKTGIGVLCSKWTS